MKLINRSLIRKLITIVLILIVSVFTYAFNLEDTINSFKDSAEKKLNETKESISDMYKKTEEKLSDTYNKTKEKTGDFFEGTKETVEDTIKDTKNKVEDYSNEFSNSFREQGQKTLKNIEEKASEIINMDTSELVNRANEIKNWTINEGKKAWGKMDEYPELKAVIEIAADEAYGETVGKAKTKIILATAIYEIAKDGKLDSKEMMAFCEEIVVISVQKKIEEVEKTVKIVGVVSKATGVMSEREVQQMLKLYNQVLDIATYNEEWDDKETLELIYYVSETLPMYNYSIDEVAPVVEKAIVQARTSSSEPKQVIQKLRRELSYTSEPTDYLYHVGLIIAGILLSFFGYKIIRSSAWLIGILFLPAILGMSVYYHSENITIAIVVVVVTLLASILIRKIFFHLMVIFAGSILTYVLLILIDSSGLIRNFPFEWLVAITVVGGIASIYMRKFITITMTSMTGAIIVVSSVASIINLISPSLFIGDNTSSVNSIGTTIEAFVMSIFMITSGLFEQIASFLHFNKLDLDFIIWEPLYFKLNNGSQYFYFSLGVFMFFIYCVVFQYVKKKPFNANKALKNQKTYELIEKKSDFYI